MEQLNFHLIIWQNLLHHNFTVVVQSPRLIYPFCYNST